MSSFYMDAVHTQYELERTQATTTPYHYHMDVTRRADFNSTTNATESTSFRMATNGTVRLLAIPRNTLTGMDPFKFQGDLVIGQRDQAAQLPLQASYAPLTPHALNFFTDASFPGKDSWEGAPRITSPRNPASLAIAWKSWPGIASTKYNKRSYQVLGCTDFRIAELNALVLALETATVVARVQPHLQRVTVFTDCQDAIRKLMAADREYNRSDPLVQRAVAASTELDNKGIRVLVHWVPGHAEIEGNEVADDLAWRTRICQNPKAMPTDIPTTMKEYEIPEHLLSLERADHVDYFKSRKGRMSLYGRTIPTTSFQGVVQNSQNTTCVAPQPACVF